VERRNVERSRWNEMGKNRETHFEKTFAGLAGAVEGPFGLTVIEDVSGAGEADMVVVV